MKPRCSKCGSGDVLLCSYQMGNVNEPVTLVILDDDGKAVDFCVDDTGGELSAPAFECQSCNAELDLSEIRGEKS